MPVLLRSAFDAAALRSIARKIKNRPHARRPLAMAAIYEGATRTNVADRRGHGADRGGGW